MFHLNLNLYLVSYLYYDTFLNAIIYAIVIISDYLSRVFVLPFIYLFRTLGPCFSELVVSKVFILFFIYNGS